MESDATRLLCLLGPTAVGKTSLAARLAHALDGEIISADSRQVYRGMDIGTGKDYQDYRIGEKTVPYHLIDILDAGYEYNVYLFKQDFLRVYNEIRDRGKLPLMCGGSGLYIESVIRNYRMLHVPHNEELRLDLNAKSFEELKGMLKLYGPVHNQTDTVNRKRLIRAIEIALYQSSNPLPEEHETLLNPRVIGLRIERVLRRKRITERLRKRLDEGLVEEVERLLDEGLGFDKLDYYGLEYRFIGRYLQKDITYEEMFTQLNTAIHQFAKRQMTYFRGMERRGIKINWIDASLPMDDRLDLALRIAREDPG